MSKSKSKNLSKSKSKNLSKSKSKNLSKSKSKSLQNFISNFEASVANVANWEQDKRLFDRYDKWKNLPIDLPPTLSQLKKEAQELLKLERLLNSPLYESRKEEIDQQIFLDLRPYLDPYGVTYYGGLEATVSLLYNVSSICETVGQYYKDRFQVPRPNQVEPRLRPYLSNPPHYSYPSNHSFQSFAKSLMLTRIVPEHIGGIETFINSQRIAENREWAGIHYASDTRAGRQLAKLFFPILEDVLKDEMLVAQQEWYEN